MTPTTHATSRSSTARWRERNGQLRAAYLRQMPPDEIARTFGLPLRRVKRLLAAQAVRWQSELPAAERQARAVEVARLAHVERTAWQAWERSQQDEVTSKLSVDGPEATGRRKAERTTRSQVGNPRFLEIVARCCERRCRLLGLDAASAEGDPLSHGRIINLAELQQGMRDEQDYIDTQRRRTLDEDLHSGAVRAPRERGTLADGAPSGDAGRSFDPDRHGPVEPPDRPDAPETWEI